MGLSTCTVKEKAGEGRVAENIDIRHGTGRNYVANGHRSFFMVFAAVVVDISDTSAHSE